VQEVPRWLIEHGGLFGVVCVVLAFVCAFLFQHWRADLKEHAKEKKAIEEQARAERDSLQTLIRAVETQRLQEVKILFQERLGDADTIHKQMLEVVKQCTTVMETTASSLDGHRDATIEHRDASKEAAEELRKLSALLTTLDKEVRDRLRTTR
jgi:hypothetical protein